MKQQLELLKKVKTIPKPSEILREAYAKGIKKCENSFKRGDAFCARGALIKGFGESKGYKVNSNYINDLEFLNSSDILFELEDELFAFHLYNKKLDDVTPSELGHIYAIQDNLTRLNDSSGNVTFLDCARELEKVGL